MLVFFFLITYFHVFFKIIVLTYGATWAWSPLPQYVTVTVSPKRVTERHRFYLRLHTNWRLVFDAQKTMFPQNLQQF